MNSFETIPVNTADFLNLVLAIPFKYTVMLFPALLAFRAIVKWTFEADASVSPANVLYAFFLLFKTSVYEALFFLVFFYDFTNRVWVWAFPKEMLLSSAFVGVLAAYEAISCLINSAQTFLTDIFK